MWTPEYVQIEDALLADGSVVAAGRGDGEVLGTIRALREDGFEGFFSLEPHLSQAHALGGSSGPEVFMGARQAFSEMLAAEQVPHG